MSLILGNGFKIGEIIIENKSSPDRPKLKNLYIAYGMPNVIHRYGATNEAEFFAVLTETFIEKPAQLQNQDPELYQLMLAYYEFDPRQWT